MISQSTSPHALVNRNEPTRTIKVAVVHHSMKLGGGSEKVIYDLLHGIDRSEFQPVLICMYGLGELGEQLRDQGCHTYEHIAGKKLDPRNATRIAKILKEEGVDILYVTDGFHNMILAQLAATIAGTPCKVLGFHSYDTVIRQAAPKSRRALCGLADVVLHPRFQRYIALADSHKNYLAEVKHLRREKISVVHNGVNLEAFEHPVSVTEARQQFDLPPQVPLVGIVAGLRKWKSHDMFLRAASKVRERRPETMFVIAGDGTERPYLEGLAKELGLSEHLRFLGIVTEIPTLLQAMDVCALSSMHEAFPLTLLEAMAARRPVVATNVGSVADIVDDGVTGFLTPFGAVDEFADAILKLVQNPTMATQFGIAGRKKVESMFTVELMVERAETLFRQWKLDPRCTLNLGDKE